MAHEIEVDAVDVVALGEVHEDAVHIDLNLGHAWIQVAPGLAVSRAVPPLVAVLRVDAAPLPGEKGVDPGVDLDPRLRGVRQPDHVGQGVEVRRPHDVLRARLVRVVEVRVACLADLDDERVQVGAAGVGDEPFHLRC